jgi:hypothetical protein
MDFQEAFLVLFWPVWVRMLGLFIAACVFISMYHILLRSHHYRRPSGKTRLAGVEYEDD